MLPTTFVIDKKDDGIFSIQYIPVFFNNGSMMFINTEKGMCLYLRNKDGNYDRAKEWPKNIIMPGFRNSEGVHPIMIFDETSQLWIEAKKQSYSAFNFYSCLPDYIVETIVIPLLEKI